MAHVYPKTKAGNLRKFNLAPGFWTFGHSRLNAYAFLSSLTATAALVDWLDSLVFSLGWIVNKLKIKDLIGTSKKIKILKIAKVDMLRICPFHYIFHIKSVTWIICASRLDNLNSTFIKRWQIFLCYIFLFFLHCSCDYWHLIRDPLVQHSFLAEELKAPTFTSH